MSTKCQERWYGCRGNYFAVTLRCQRCMSPNRRLLDVSAYKYSNNEWGNASFAAETIQRKSLALSYCLYGGQFIVSHTMTKERKNVITDGTQTPNGHITGPIKIGPLAA